MLYINHLILKNFKESEPIYSHISSKFLFAANNSFFEAYLYHKNLEILFQEKIFLHELLWPQNHKAFLTIL